MRIVLLLFGAGFLTAGLLFAGGRLCGSLPGWEGLSREERARSPLAPLCRGAGAMIALCGGIFLAAGASTAFRTRCFTGAMLLWLLCSGAAALFIGKKEREAAAHARSGK